MADDIVTRLRSYWEGQSLGDVSGDVAKAADEIERLRAERLQWFVVARQLCDALIGGEDTDAAVDEYLRTRGRLEDPREQAAEYEAHRG